MSGAPSSKRQVAPVPDEYTADVAHTGLRKLKMLSSTVTSPPPL